MGWAGGGGGSGGCGGGGGGEASWRGRRWGQLLLQAFSCVKGVVEEVVDGLDPHSHHREEGQVDQPSRHPPPTVLEGKVRLG